MIRTVKILWLLVLLNRGKTSNEFYKSNSLKSIYYIVEIAATWLRLFLNSGSKSAIELRLQ